MSNNANLLADLDGFYRGSDSLASPTQQQAQPPLPSQAPLSQPQAGFQPASGPSGFGQGAPAATGDDFLDGFDDDWGGFETAEPAAPSLTVPKPFNVAPVTSPVPAPSDPFESFTVAKPSPTPAPTTQANPPSAPKSGKEDDFVKRNKPVRVPTFDLMSNNLVDLSPQAPSESSSKKPPRKSGPRDPNVLFDADDLDEEDEEDDDFGDFEGADPWEGTAASHPAPQAKPTTSPSADLLALDEPLPTPRASTQNALTRPTSLLTDPSTMPTSPYPSAAPPSPFQQRNPFPGLAVSTSQVQDLKKTEEPPSASPITSWPVFEGDGGSAKMPAKEDWPPFEDFTPDYSIQVAPAVRPAKAEEPESWDWDEIDAPSTTSQQLPSLSSRDDYDDKEPPPTNISPPSILMTILPELFALADPVLKPTAGHSPAARKKLLSSPATVSFLRAYLLIATVAARILAGRKLRWNRDRLLAQNMTVSAAGAKGMKLAGLDKAEAGREDREAADVVAAWRGHVGRVRSAVAGANAAISEDGGQPLRVPEIGESMRVSTVKVAPSAPKQCVVCGLKREERVAKVDFEVEDSFGEWWVEHWGHRACRNFWKEHELRLRQR